MRNLEPLPIAWRKSTFSGLNGCVEVGFNGFNNSPMPSVLVRDSKVLDSEVLAFSSSEWANFIESAKRGHFDVK